MDLLWGDETSLWDQQLSILKNTQERTFLFLHEVLSLQLESTSCLFFIKYYLGRNWKLSLQKSWDLFFSEKKVILKTDAQKPREDIGFRFIYKTRNSCTIQFSVICRSVVNFTFMKDCGLHMTNYCLGKYFKGMKLHWINIG